MRLKVERNKILKNPVFRAHFGRETTLHIEGFGKALQTGRHQVAQKTEKSIVEAAQNGCLDSFAALYRRHYSAMVALAYSVLADVHLAEDAAQQAFVIACRDLPKLKSKDKFAAWLAGICRNVARQMQRSGIKLAEVKNRPAAWSTDRPPGDLINKFTGFLRVRFLVKYSGILVKN